MMTADKKRRFLEDYTGKKVLVIDTEQV